MLVSWSWLSRYVDLPLSPEELGDRFALSGLNLESIQRAERDSVIDLEVTSNRGDCLGHIGIAREAAALLGKELSIPNPQPVVSETPCESLATIANEYPEVCPRYLARVILGVRIGPSPQWLADALVSVGISLVNNVVDITNYVMFECGQPLHAFDLDKLQGPGIIVRRAREGETLQAIDHRNYVLEPSDCVIADHTRAVAIAGVMGGAATEVNERTTNLLIEAAAFAPLSVRATGRRLKLRSPSSYRFERKVDLAGLDWASRRCCQLILETAGGKLAQGVLEAGRKPIAPVGEPTTITLRWSQVQRILGISIPQQTALRFLLAIGCKELNRSEQTLVVQPPSWRHDLTREIDLIEELARLYGYDKIPEDSPIPVVPSRVRPEDQALQIVRGVLTSVGLFEAMTPSLSPTTTESLLSPWTDAPPLETVTSMLEGARCLRRSLIPSLLVSHQANLAASGLSAELFEIAHVYLPQGPTALPLEQKMLAWVSQRDYSETKGIVEALLARLGIDGKLTIGPFSAEHLEEATSASFWWKDQRVGIVGSVREQLGKVTVCELNLTLLLSKAELVPQHTPISPFPGIARDLNLIMDEQVRWSDLEQGIRSAAGPSLVGIDYRETYRDPTKDGANRKRILFSLRFQRPDATLSSSDADASVSSILEACERKFDAKLLDPRHG
jgi:phenylalanyl-tRNA synthetase beta chain